MDKQIYISIIVPTHNRMDCLLEALDSIRQQSFTDYEVIVVDDGSTDGTAEALLRYAAENGWLIADCGGEAAMRSRDDGGQLKTEEKVKSGNAQPVLAGTGREDCHRQPGGQDERERTSQKLKLKYLRQENAGPGAARNLGAKEARGEYLAFLDSDDLWFPWTLQCFADSIKANNYPAILCGKIQENPDEASLSAIAPSKTASKVYSNYISSYRDECFVGAGKMVVKKSNFHEAGGFSDLPINLEDHDCVLRLGNNDGFVEIVEPSTLIRRRHEGNLTGIPSKTYDGARHLIQMEKKGAYPGGDGARIPRWTIISRHVRPVAVAAAMNGDIAVAWEIYKATFRWHVKLRKWKFLVGLPMAIITRAVRRA